MLESIFFAIIKIEKILFEKAKFPGFRKEN